MANLTLSMIVKNEEKFLPGCLDSVKEIVDEIVIVDTGSTDRTVEIAEKYGAKVFHFDWINDFSEARNFALSKSTGKWILYLDADERLSPNSIDELKRIIKSNNNEGIWCIVKSENDKGGFPDIMNYIRLFKSNPDAKFSGKVHEQILPSIEQLKYKFRRSGIFIDHLGYNISNEDLQRKARRNLEILLDDYAAGESKYIAFQIAQSYAILKEEDEAARYFKMFVDDKNFMKDYRAIGYRYLAGIEHDKGNLKNAVDYINKGLAVANTQPLLLIVASQVYQKIGNLKEAETFCRKTYEANEKLMRGEIISNYDILIPEEYIFYQGIDIAIRAGNINAFNFYFGKLESQKKNSLDQKGMDELRFIKSLLNNEDIPESAAVNYSDVVNKGNMKLFLTLISNYKRPASKLFVIQKIISTFGDDPKLKLQLGLCLVENSRLPEAVEIFKEVIDSGENEPSAFFYLISAYIKMEKWDKVKNCIIDAEKAFSNVPEVISRINMIKEKLARYFIG